MITSFANGYRKEGAWRSGRTDPSWGIYKKGWSLWMGMQEESESGRPDTNHQAQFDDDVDRGESIASIQACKGNGCAHTE